MKFSKAVRFTDTENVEVKPFVDALVNQLIRQAVEPNMPRESQIPVVITLLKMDWGKHSRGERWEGGF